MRFTRKRRSFAAKAGAAVRQQMKADPQRLAMELPIIDGSALHGLEQCPLPRSTPFGIKFVSETQFSIARFHGAIEFNGNHYCYIAATDELIREGVLRWRIEQLRAAQTNLPQKPQPTTDAGSNARSADGQTSNSNPVPTLTGELFKP